jgi:hypothetical protein
MNTDKADCQPLTLQQTAGLLGVSYSRLHYGINTKRIEARKLGRQLYFLGVDLGALREYFEKEENEVDI